LTLVDPQGKFISTVGPFSDRYVKNYKDDPDYVDVNIDISVELKKTNKAFNVAKYEHNYPHCWRTDKPVLYYPLDSWFVKTSSMKERMFELNQTIKWKPKSTGDGRFGKWLENLQDWNLSRTRYWGIPLPIWRTADGEQEKCINSLAVLQEEIDKANKALGKDQTVPKDLHRPYIDDIVLVNDAGEPMHRELDLIDVWFDSGSMPYAQWHYPFENKEKFANKFPADFIAEGVDQTRGWFYTLHAIGTMVFDSVAFKNVTSNGLVQDKEGKKMSKSKGNAVDPFQAIAQHGADANRWYMIVTSPPWDNLKYDPDGVVEVRNKFFGTLFNTYKFFAGYANIDGFTYKENNILLTERPEIDQWVLSVLNSVIKEVNEAYADYEPTVVARKVQNFVMNDLSNWYVRLCRRRFWKGEYTEDKIAAYQTLYTCMEAVSKMMAPIAPFFADYLYKNLNEVTKQEKHISVHLASFPRVSHDTINKELEQRMNYAQRISSMVLSLRKKENIRVRQPLQKIMLPILDDSFSEQVEGVKNLILAEVNIKEIEYIKDTAGIIKKKIKPNFKTLGRKLGKNMKTAIPLINQLGQEDIAAIEKTNSYQLTVDGENYELTLEDFEIIAEDIPGWLVTNDGDLTVAMDISLTDDLRAEGTARELVNRIQNLRKTKDFNVTDRIKITLEKQETVVPAVELFNEYISTEVLANQLTLADSVASEDSIEIDGTVMGLRIELAN